MGIGFSLCLFFIVGSAWAEAVSSTALIDQAAEYDGREVVYQGEAIGEVMRRKNGAWVNINDGEASIGIWMPPIIFSATSPFDGCPCRQSLTATIDTFTPR